MENNESLTACPTCGKQVAKSANTCPHCGANLAKPNFASVLIWIGLALLGLMLSWQSGVDIGNAFFG